MDLHSTISINCVTTTITERDKTRRSLSMFCRAHQVISLLRALALCSEFRALAMADSTQFCTNSWSDALKGFGRVRAGTSCCRR